MSFIRFIENQTEFQAFKQDVANKVIYVVPIFANARQHPILNALSLLIIGTADSENLYVFPTSHNDALSVPLEWFYELAPALVITPQKKRLLHKFRNPPTFPIIDYRHIEHQRHITTNYDDFLTPSAKHSLNKFFNHKNVHKAISIYEWVQYASNFITYMKTSGLKTVPDSTLEDIVIPVTSFLEKSGIHVDAVRYVEKYGRRAESHIVDGLIYSEYNPYTLTGRCSCGWDGVNFTALNKKDGTRDIFTSRHPDGKMVLVDFESFHLRLIASWMNYTLPTSSVHTFLGQQYFNKMELTDEEYEQSKQITFQHLYSEQKLTNPSEFFQKVYDYSQQLFDDFVGDGFVTTPGGQILDMVEDATRSKVFNYYVQMMETETAMEIIHQLIPMWTGIKSKIVLYTYDSLLFDVHPAEMHFMDPTVEIMTQGGRWPVRSYVGTTYGNLQRQDVTFLPK